jgi:predicted RNA-binding protein with PIN domain
MRRSPRPKGTLVRWLVDAMNVIGTRPDGWWRDRDAAVRRLVDELRAFAAAGEDVTVVLDAGPDDLGGDGVRVVVAPRRGRNAADDEIARLLAADDDPASVCVVTSDADLAARARAAGASVEGAGTFRRRLG